MLELGEQVRVDLTLPDGTAVTQVLTGPGWICDKSRVSDMQPEVLVNAVWRNDPLRHSPKRASAMTPR